MVDPDIIESLAEEILTDIELDRIALGAIALKCSRLARFLGDEEHRLVFKFEASGYPRGKGGIDPTAFELARKVGRVCSVEEKGAQVEKMDASAISTWEGNLEANKIALVAAVDRNISLSSANPNQHLIAPGGNGPERSKLQSSISAINANISKTRAYAHDYSSAILHQIRFSGTASTIFERTRAEIDLLIVDRMPKSTEKTTSITDNLKSDNMEDWANAVHSCRRLLQDLADSVFPVRDAESRGGKVVKLGTDQYINRLMAYIEDNQDSKRYKEIVGSTLSYIGERLDAIFRAAQKGSHAEINSRDEAERYVIYTFLVVGDILRL